MVVSLMKNEVRRMGILIVHGLAVSDGCEPDEK